MAVAETSESCLRTLRELRVSLVDRLEGHIDSLLELLFTREVLTRDDREEVLCERGPRGRVRKVLDILHCKGDEAAGIFLSASSHLSEVQPQALDQPKQTQSVEYCKVIQKHKAVLKRRSESILHYNTRHGEKIPFSKHYVNLLIVKGHHSLEIKKHEVLAFGQQRLSLQHKAMEQQLIKPAQLFSDATGCRPAKKILVTGVAGIGKTVLVQKILHDFGNGEEHLAFDFIIHLTFRDLNLISKMVSFRELVLRKNSHLAKHLDAILENDTKLLIILDGFDEFKHYMGCDVDMFVTEPDEEGELVEVLSSLIQGELLPGASVLLTSRPMAVSYVPVGAVDCFTLITGFSSTEIRDFFQRFFQEEELAHRMFEAMAANELMLTLCYIPAFCHIMCSILKDSNSLSKESPRTMTDIYVQYLVALLRSHSQGRVGSSLGNPSDSGNQEQLVEIVLKLGQLAYQKLMDHETLFYASDAAVATLTNCSMASTFLDTTFVQEPGCIQDVYSFTHLTIQEFFAALYCAMVDSHVPNVLECGLDRYGEGHLDLFARFLSGLLSERNQRLLSRNMGFKYQDIRLQSYRLGLLRDIKARCENGAYILTQLHCLFEQQDTLLVQALQPKTLRINLTDVTLSTMDYSVVKHFLNEMQGKISELDLTGTNVSAEALRDLQPCMLRCERLWLGENSLNMEAVQVIADVLQSSDTMMYLGMEGNRISYKGLSALSALTPFPLRNVVAIWNDVSDEETESLNRPPHGQCFTVSFTDDSIWEEWGKWVLQRCEVSSSEKLVTVLYKVCNISIRCLEIPWARTFYRKLSQLISSRIDQCTDDDVRRKLEKFEAIVSS